MASAISVQDQDQHPKRVCLGIIATAHGVKGLVKVKCEATDPGLLNGFCFTSETGTETLQIHMKNSMGKYWLAEVSGIHDRDQALSLRGTELWINRETLPTLEDDDEFYIQDLIGIKATYEDGEYAGTITAIDNFGAGDLLALTSQNGQEFYVPFTKDDVPEISLNDSKVVLKRMLIK